jgi:hypothetical protein
VFDVFIMHITMLDVINLEDILSKARKEIARTRSGQLTTPIWIQSLNWVSDGEWMAAKDRLSN